MSPVSFNHTSPVAQQETLGCLGAVKNKITSLARGVTSCCLPCCGASSREAVEGDREMEAVLLSDPNPTITRLLRQGSDAELPGLVDALKNQGYTPPRLGGESNTAVGLSPVPTEAAAASLESSVLSEDEKEVMAPWGRQTDSSAQTERLVETVRTALDTDAGAPRGVRLSAQADPSTPSEEEEVPVGWTWADLGGALASALQALSARGGSEE
jgi:hypothetical protein